MIIRFSSKTNINGWTHQLEIDTEKKQYKYGSFIFHTPDVSNMTIKQLDRIVKVLIYDDYKKID